MLLLARKFPFPRIFARTTRPILSPRASFASPAAAMAKIHTPIPNLKLNDGNAIPMLGYGTGTAWYKTGDEAQLDQACIDAAKLAIGMGYTHLDGAEVYKTETELGRAIAESGTDRSKLFVTTKAMAGIPDPAPALRASLSKLGLTHVDLYLLHSPWQVPPSSLPSVWAAMEQLQADGLARSIGVSNFLPEHLDALLKDAKVVPAVNQVELHAYLQRRELLAYHKEKGIATVAYAPLTPVTKGAPGPLDGRLAQLARKYAVTPGEILLRWCVDQDIVAVTTSGKEQRLSDYLRAMTFKLTPNEIREINDLGHEKHFRGFWTHKIGEDDKR